ncbi:hypothetical protein [Maritimibacter sp. UBA3975]|uniref:hypothetical protein n=1 Tax=Maritimibacter sp. UBA3975 TaxID=1946833 RepID=UPI0025C4557F|nr:hypothetical protein [Maritimibacter sp. UBA3975]|tara:strand:+ start:27558 stop:27728 length:171 start_codon:yes stop_codon:yes gene_type:complete
MFGGIEIIEVEPGTVIENNGEKIEVTETNAVRKGWRCYMTPDQVAALKAHPDVKSK